MIADTLKGLIMLGLIPALAVTGQLLAWVLQEHGPVACLLLTLVVSVPMFGAFCWALFDIRGDQCD